MLRALAIFAAVVAFAPEAALADGRVRGPVGLSIFPPLEIFHGKDTTVVGASVNVFYGRSRAVYGVELGLVNTVREDVGLLQVAVLVNQAGGGCYGVCAAGLGNMHGKVVGAQLGLFGNDAGSIPFGFQVGLLNVIRRDAGLAVQIGVANTNNRRLEDILAAMSAKKGDVITVHLFAGAQRGLQIGMVNTSDDYRGLRLGLLFNGGKHGKGIALAALGNVQDSWTGIQAGLWNHAGTMRGLQVGVINTARVLKGVQIGAINVATKNALPFTILVNVGF
jgi:hypothetical protein